MCFVLGFFLFCVHVCERLTLLLACVVRQVLVSCFRLLLSRLTQPAVAVQANTHAEKTHTDSHLRAYAHKCFKLYVFSFKQVLKLLTYTPTKKEKSWSVRFWIRILKKSGPSQCVCVCRWRLLGWMCVFACSYCEQFPEVAFTTDSSPHANPLILDSLGLVSQSPHFSQSFDWQDLLDLSGLPK